jgi:ribosome-binding protein aMBF1 (putative translation factor)
MSKRRCEYCGRRMGLANYVVWDEVCLIVCDDCRRAAAAWGTPTRTDGDAAEKTPRRVKR